jgi:hypothetical protein
LGIQMRIDHLPATKLFQGAFKKLAPAVAIMESLEEH